MNEVLLSEVFLKILNMSISASWLVLAVLLLRLVLKKAPKWVSVLLWGFVAVRLICPFTIESVLSLIPSAETVSPEIMMDWTPEISTGIGSVDTVINPIITQTFAPNPATSANPLQILIPVAGILWFTGIVAMLLYTAVSYFLLRRRVATAVLLRNNIYQSENVDSPFVLGIIKPKIYLPFQMDGKNLEHVIAHEESHIRRKDHWWKPFGFVLLALHWFNPLMWLGYILLCRDIELACDEKVIKEMDNENRADYTQALVACSVNRRRIAACPLAFGEVGVKERVKSVMNYKKPAFWIIVVAVVTCIAVAVCFLTNPLNRVSLSKLKSDEINMPGILDDITGMIVTYEGISVACPEQADVNRFLATMEKIDVSRDPISLSRSEDRDKDFTIMINANTELHFNKSFTEFWVDNHVKPSLTHRITNPETAKELILDYNFTQSSALGVDGLIPVIDVPEGSAQFAAAVLEVHDTYLLVKPEGVAAEGMTDKIEISLKERESWPIPQVGDSILVVYDGNIQETYPARITKVYRVEIMNYDSGPIKTVYGNFKTYYKNTNGTWQVGGRNYKYRLVITGRMHNAAVDSTFVYLSNIEKISFDQAWKAAGLSSNMDDYFSVEDAVLVEWLNGGTSSVGGDDKPANGEILDSNGNVILVDTIDKAIADAILEQNAGDRFLNEPTGLIPVESHYMLGIVSKSGTPLVGQTNHMEEVTVYVQYVYQRYSYSEGKLERVAGTGRPAMITFSKNADGGYTLKEFWEPTDGSLYAEDIRKMFPADIADMILATDSDIVDVEALESNCLSKAQAYVSGISN